jgi:hypothetical protein
MHAAAPTRRAVIGGGAALLAAVAAAAPLARARAAMLDPHAVPPGPGAWQQGGWMRAMVPPGTVSADLDGMPLAIAPDGTVFAGFDRDAPATATLGLTDAAGRRSTMPLAIAPGGWALEHINTPLRPPGIPDADYVARRRIETAAITRARQPDPARPAVEGWRQTMIRPAPGRFSGRFGAQRIYRGEPGAYHGGLDIAAGTGTLFVAPADGVVVLAAATPFTLEGRLLMLDHGMGLGSAFLHCSTHLVALGDRVRQGQPIGTVGMTGRATGPHLHWALAWQSASGLRRLDPLLMLG